MSARFPTKTFRAEDAATGAWFAADAVLDTATAGLVYERVRAGGPPSPAAGPILHRLKREVDARATAWARRTCGGRARRWPDPAHVAVDAVA